MRNYRINKSNDKKLLIEIQRDLMLAKIGERLESDILDVNCFLNFDS